MNEMDNDMITRYLDGEMENEQLRAFEEQLLKDPELQKKLELTREVNETLKIKLHPDQNELAYRNTLAGLREEYFKPKTKIVSITRFRWATALAAVFIAAIVLTIWSPWKKSLFQQYAVIQMPGIAERSASNDSVLMLAAQYFNDKDFNSAIPIFETMLKKDPENTFVRYYYAIALLENGQADQSKMELTTLYNGNSLFRYEAAFYIAMSYLKENDKTRCKEWLDKIPADAASYVKAQELLKKL